MGSTGTCAPGVAAGVPGAAAGVPAGDELAAGTGTVAAGDGEELFPGAGDLGGFSCAFFTSSTRSLTCCSSSPLAV